MWLNIFIGERKPKLNPLKPPLTIVPLIIIQDAITQYTQYTQNQNNNHNNSINKSGWQSKPSRNDNNYN